MAGGVVFQDSSARIALTDIPPRSEHELDPVTLHNEALVNMDDRPADGFDKLQFLLQHESFPPDTFANLLLLYIKYEVNWLTFDSVRDGNFGPRPVEHL